MIYKEKLLDDVKVKHILNFYEFCKFRDGSNTGAKDKDIKYNLELYDEDHNQALQKLFLSEVYKNGTIQKCLFAKCFSTPMFLKYDQNMHYSFHNDFYKQNNGVKTHYSVTVFLSDPSEYEGGELTLKIGDQELIYKEEPGIAIIYPTGLWHTVNKVTSGCRKVAVFWFESEINDPLIRECCFDLSQLIIKHNKKDEGYELSNQQQIMIDNIKYRLLRNYGTFS